MLTLSITAALAFVLSCAATRGLLELLRRGAVLDHPNDRSSHAVPTPRGGGLAVVVAVTVTGLGWAIVEGRTSQDLGAIFGLTIALSVLSFIDDLRNLSATVRLLAHAVAVTVGLWILGDGAFAAFLPAWLDLPVTAFAWLWFINLYNFMDGIDGIVGSETMSVGIGVVGLALLGLAPDSASGPAAALTGAALGFLVWNWHPARLFLGDAGSVPLGFLIGFLLIATAAGDDGSGGSVAAALILPLIFVADASITLLRRLKRRARLTEAHREHAYQRAVQGGWSHARVCRVVLAANAALAAIAWGLAPGSPLVGLTVAVAVAAATYLLLLRVGRTA